MWWWYCQKAWPWASDEAATEWTFALLHQGHPQRPRPQLRLESSSLGWPRCNGGSQGSFMQHKMQATCIGNVKLLLHNCLSTYSSTDLLLSSKYCRYIFPQQQKMLSSPQYKYVFSTFELLSDVKKSTSCERHAWPILHTIWQRSSF